MLIPIMRADKKRHESTSRKENEPIDFVITWVDGNDEAWRKQKRKFESEIRGSADSRERRYRDWGWLKYLFRGIETYAPWVNKVYFITCGHLPSWLNVNAEKLVVVKHEDYIPHDCLPTFSSRPIENNVHRIESLSEHFVLFNDDMFITNHVRPDHFFKDGKPVLCPMIHPLLPRAETGVMAHTYLNNISAVNRAFNYRKSLARNLDKWFNPARIGLKAAIENVYCSSFTELPGIRPVHVPVPLLKSTIKKVWDAEPILLEKTSRHRFRSPEDVSQYIFWIWQLMTGEFYPQSASKLGHYSIIVEDTWPIMKSIVSQKYSLLCINDMGGFEDDESFEEARINIEAAWETVFPKPSVFEINR